MNFVLAVGLFGCYSTTVSPNEADAASGDAQSRNYRYFFNRYVQFFYRSQPYLEIRRLSEKVSKYIDASHALQKM